MTRTQQYLDMLFERFPVGELGGSPVRDTFEQLRSKCAGAEDLDGMLRTLYRVELCDDLALGLLWVVDRANADPSRLEPTGEEEEVFFRGLRKCLELPETSDTSVSMEPAGGAFEEQTSTFAQAQEIEPQPEPTAEVPPTMPIQENVELASGVGTAPSSSEGTSDPVAFGKQLEQFLEAVQGGSDERAPLLEVIRSSCSTISGAPESPDDLKQYTENLNGFLHYVMENQLLDDVRVMNLVTNIQDPYSQWITTAEGERVGLLDQATELLRDFRTMFE